MERINSSNRRLVFIVALVFLFVVLITILTIKIITAKPYACDDGKSTVECDETKTLTAEEAKALKCGNEAITLKIDVATTTKDCSCTYDTSPCPGINNGVVDDGWVSVRLEFTPR